MSFTHAIIMGDLVGSERAQSVTRLHASFNKGVEAINTSHRRTLASPLTITLGDEFQGLTRSMTSALEIARTMRLALLHEDVRCRFVIGLAKIETPINRRKSWNMMGPGLAAARSRLGDKEDENAIRFSLPQNEVLENLLDAVGRSITDIQENWTLRQTEIAMALESSTTTAGELIQKLKIAPNTFYKIRRAARIDLHDRQWQSLFRAVAELDRKENLR